MISKLVKEVGSYSITRDEKGNHSLLDSCAREVASGPELEAMEGAAKLLIVGLPRGPIPCRCGLVHEGAIITDSHSCLFPQTEVA